MKLTKKLLKEMILKEMNSLNPKHEPKYDRILRILRDGTYRSVAIMSGQFPMGEKPDPRLADVERVANAAPSTPNFGIKNTFKAKFIEKAIAVFIKTILGNPAIPSVGDAAPNIA